MTSANVTYYEVNSIDGKTKHKNSQHCMCKNTINDWLKTFTPAENYLVQMIHPDENEVERCSKRVNLKKYLEGKYRFTLWREEDGDREDEQYCAEHGHQDLKENCVYCLKRKLEEAEAYIKQMDAEHFKSDLKSGVCPFCKTHMMHYDGALGYESMRCYDCGVEVNASGLSFMEE